MASGTPLHTPLFAQPFDFDSESVTADFELNRILYDIPSQPRSNSNASIYQDCVDEHRSSEEDLEQEDNRDQSLVSSTPFSSLIGLNSANVSANGAKISSNGRENVLAYELQEHLLVPDYPDTDKRGVLHLIHLKRNPLENLSNDENAINEVFTQLMSSVCFTYV